jgi:uncharacterized protein
MHPIQRNLADKLIQLLRFFPVVALVGARQVGKTTLARCVAPSWYYLDLEKPADYERVEHDPALLFEQYPRELIIDEAQLCPALFNVLRGVIDERRDEKGRFIITGSSSASLLSSLTESLAGRMAVIELDTLKMNEYYQYPLSPLYDFLCGRLPVLDLLTHVPMISNKDLQQFWLKGGYPEPLLNEENAFYPLWMQQYRASYVYRDVAVLFPKLNKIKYQRFVAMLSQLSGTIINRSELARSLEVDEKTAREYLKIAEGTFIWREMLSFERSSVKSIVKMPKGHMRDSGLLNDFLRIDSLDKLYEHPSIGRLFESFVIEEIIKGLSATLETNWNASYYRTRAGVEVDLVLDGYFGVIPIEIKYGSYTSMKQLENLKQFMKTMDDVNAIVPYGLVINQSDEARWLTDRILQIPAVWL